MNLSPRNKRILIIALVILAIGVGYYLFKRRKKKKESNDPFSKLLSPNDKKATQTKSKEQLLDEVQNDNTSFPLKKGSKGKRVEQAQRYIVSKKGANLDKYGIDGIWGTETEAEMQKILGRNNISKDYFIKTEMYLEPTAKFK